ncbi:MAG: protein-disulfide isomerase, partial [Candidatus Nitrosopelagicus sp.]|nr:protein-disulfide isomerase [Candidatus Nitrosopelagicus sp.]
NYATKHSAEKRKQTLIAIGGLSIIIVIVGYAGWMFINMTDSAPGGPENAGVINSEHSHTGILVKIFGDPFDFSAPAYQIKSPWIHFEGRDGSTIHKHATGVTLGYLFDSLSLDLNDQCFVFQDGRSFCSNDDYKLSFFVNGEQVSDLRDIEPMEDDKVLITYGAETPEEIQSQLRELESQELIK